MKIRTLHRIIAVACATAAALASGRANADVTFTLPATADPWLAGMPDGTTASAGPPGNTDALDLAPPQSPLLLTGIPVTSGIALTFIATGIVNHASLPGRDSGPEGRSVAAEAHTSGAEHGISDIVAPLNSVVGVFLADEQPDTSPAPSGSTSARPSAETTQC